MGCPSAKHLDRPLWQTLETLRHEYVHLWQQNYGQHPVNRNYHNREFVDRCESIGLHPAIGIGCHLKPADGVFADFLRAYDIPEPPPLAKPILTPKGKPLDWWTDPEKKKRGRSSLRKWTCGCQNVRVGTQEFHAQCLICGNEFVLAEKDETRANTETEPEDDPSTVDSGWQQDELDLYSTEEPSPPDCETPSTFSAAFR